MSNKEEYKVVEEGDWSLPFSDRYGQGCYVRESWYQNTVLHRTFGPAVTVRHPVSLAVAREEFYRNGQRHRYGGPAIIVRDPETGCILEARYFEKGREVAPRDPLIQQPEPDIP